MAKQVRIASPTFAVDYEGGAKIVFRVDTLAASEILAYAKDAPRLRKSIASFVERIQGFKTMEGEDVRPEQFLQLPPEILLKAVKGFIEKSTEILKEGTDAELGAEEGNSDTVSQPS